MDIITNTVVSETHTRTLAKTVLYRIFSILLTMFITFIIGGTGGQMAAMGAAAFVLGSVTYYLHDRIWLFFNWHRDGEGVDSTKRSIAKTVAYRIVVLIITFFVAKVVLTGSSNETAATFAVVMMVANAVLYFVVEKAGNYISWGRVKPVDIPN
jgi:uncharacterized membrane protein